MKRHFKFPVLITLALMMASGLVYAQPVPIGTTVQPAPFESNPTAYTDQDTGSVSQSLMYDGSLLTSGVITLGIDPAVFTAYFELRTFTTPTTPQFDPGWVEIKMKYETPGTINDKYRIEYSTDGVTWIDLQPDVSGADSAFTAAIRPWSQLSEPSDGVWSWGDITSLRVRVFCTKDPGPPAPAWDNRQMVIYEVWVTVYPLPLPPSTSTVVSVQPPAVMSVRPYDPMLAPAGPDGFFFVEVYVQDAIYNATHGLADYEFTMSYDTAIVSYKDAWSYWPWIDMVVTPDEAAGLLSVVATAEPPIVDVGFFGNSSMARVYFTVDASGTTDLELIVSKLGAPGGIPISHTVHDGWFSAPHYMSLMPGGTLPPGDPRSTDWHELYPDYCKKWHLASWNDTDKDGNLSPSDQIDMTNETGWKYWFHVDDITTTIHWTFKDPVTHELTGELGAAEPYMPVDLPMGDPIGSYWHQIYPVYSRWLMITSWNDTDSSLTFEPSDQFDFEYLDEPFVTYWAHLDDVSTDILVSQKPIPPEPPPVHDVAVTKVTPSKNVVGQGYLMSINVTVENQGDCKETFNVSVFYDDTIITLPDGKNHTTTTLTSGNSTTVTFIWNTTGVVKGNYTIRAEATQVQGETDLADNTHINGEICVTTPGDLDCDDDVDIDDIRYFCDAYIKYWTPPVGKKDWEPPAGPDPDQQNCDFDDDCDIDIDDIRTFCSAYIEYWTP